jgi:hypothetical protein
LRGHAEGVAGGEGVLLAAREGDAEAERAPLALGGSDRVCEGVEESEGDGGAEVVPERDVRGLAVPRRGPLAEGEPLRVRVRVAAGVPERLQLPEKVAEAHALRVPLAGEGDPERVAAPERLGEPLAEAQPERRGAEDALRAALALLTEALCEALPEGRGDFEGVPDSVSMRVARGLADAVRVPVRTAVGDRDMVPLADREGEGEALRALLTEALCEALPEGRGDFVRTAVGDRDMVPLADREGEGEALRALLTEALCEALPEGRGDFEGVPDSVSVRVARGLADAVRVPVRTAVGDRDMVPLADREGEGEALRERAPDAEARGDGVEEEVGSAPPPAAARGARSGGATTATGAETVESPRGTERRSSARQRSMARVVGGVGPKRKAKVVAGGPPGSTNPPSSAWPNAPQWTFSSSRATRAPPKRGWARRLLQGARSRTP